jgi:hypothetical protein
MKENHSVLVFHEAHHGQLSAYCSTSTIIGIITRDGAVHTGNCTGFEMSERRRVAAVEFRCGSTVQILRFISSFLPSAT